MYHLLKQVPANQLQKNQEEMKIFGWTSTNQSQR